MSEAVSDVLASVGQDDVATGGCTSSAAWGSG